MAGAALWANGNTEVAELLVRFEMLVAREQPERFVKQCSQRDQPWDSSWLVIPPGIIAMLISDFGSCS